MRTFVLLMWLCCLSLAPLQAATDAENRENFLAALRLVDEGRDLCSSEGSSKAKEKNLRQGVEKLEQAIALYDQIDGAYLDRLYPNLANRFYVLRNSQRLYVNGVKAGSVEMQANSAKLWEIWHGYWFSHGGEITAKLDATAPSLLATGKAFVDKIAAKLDAVAPNGPSFWKEVVIVPSLWVLAAFALLYVVVKLTALHGRHMERLKAEGVEPKKRPLLAVAACLVALVAYVAVCDWLKWKPGADGNGLRYIVLACCLTAIFKGVRG